MMENHKTTDFIWGSVLGGAVGILATLLMTTQKGKQLRKAIADKYHEFEEELSEKAENLKESAENQVHKVKEKVKAHL